MLSQGCLDDTLVTSSTRATRLLARRSLDSYFVEKDSVREDEYGRATGD
jgi:hypothetical protein